MYSAKDCLIKSYYQTARLLTEYRYCDSFVAKAGVLISFFLAVFGLNSTRTVVAGHFRFGDSFYNSFMLAMCNVCHSLRHRILFLAIFI